MSSPTCSTARVAEVLSRINDDWIDELNKRLNDYEALGEAFEGAEFFPNEKEFKVIVESMGSVLEIRKSLELAIAEHNRAKNQYDEAINNRTGEIGILDESVRTRTGEIGTLDERHQIVTREFESAQIKMTDMQTQMQTIGEQQVVAQSYLQQARKEKAVYDSRMAKLSEREKTLKQKALKTHTDWVQLIEKVGKALEDKAEQEKRLKAEWTAVRQKQSEEEAVVKAAILKQFAERESLDAKAETLARRENDIEGMEASLATRV